jgi:hypothetical protein
VIIPEFAHYPGQIAGELLLLSNKHQMKYIPPKVYAKNFTCPHCAAIAHQEWRDESLDGGHYGNAGLNRLRVGKCAHCSKHTVWIDGEMAFPFVGTAPTPNGEMPDSVKKCYLEAAEIVSRSPRAAAALLRLGLQLLCMELNEKGKNINDDIAALVKKGLPEIVQQSLDVVRVTGNAAVHPGQIDTDDPAVVSSLFDLTNIIVEYMIAMPKRVSGLYSGLPTAAIDGINRRDA